MAVRGLIIRLYRIAADALVADMLPPEERLEAYSFMRSANNTGIAIGPAIGGFLAVTSYDIAFYIAAGVCPLRAGDPSGPQRTPAARISPKTNALRAGGLRGRRLFRSSFLRFVLTSL